MYISARVGFRNGLSFRFLFCFIRFQIVKGKRMEINVKAVTRARFLALSRPLDARFRHVPGGGFGVGM